MRLGRLLVSNFSFIITTVFGAMLLTSPVFKNFETIPSLYGCDAPHRIHSVSNPPLEWLRPPVKTQSYVLMVDDIDADGFVQWIVKDIPRDVMKIAEGATGLEMPPNSVELQNSWHETVYGGVCPPPNSVHTYRFRLYARSVPVTNFVAFPDDASFNITSQFYDTQLNDDQNTLYCAVLIGRYFVGPIPPNPEDIPFPPTGREHFTSPIKVLRYIKPSESLNNKRKHYSPRPFGHFPYNVTEFCERKKGRVDDKEYAQICGVNDGKVLEKIEGGGAEEQQAKFYASEIKKERVPVKYFDKNQYPDARPWLVKNGVAIAPNYSTPISDLSSVVAASTPTKQTIKPQFNIQNNINEDSRLTNNFINNEKQIRLLRNKNQIQLIEWDCDEENKKDFILRCPLFDSCDGKVEAIGVLPNEFQCDKTDSIEFLERLQNSSQRIPHVSPPLSWRLENTTNVQSFVLVLEDSLLKNVHWIVKNIPVWEKEIRLGASYTELLPKNSEEETNSFGVKGYTPPCPTNKLSKEFSFKFHLFGRNSDKTDFSAFTNPESLFNLLSDSIIHTTLDFVIENKN